MKQIKIGPTIYNVIFVHSLTLFPHDPIIDIDGQIISLLSHSNDKRSAN